MVPCNIQKVGFEDDGKILYDLVLSPGTRFEHKTKEIDSAFIEPYQEPERIFITAQVIRLANYLFKTYKVYDEGGQARKIGDNDLANWREIEKANFID